MPILDEHEEQLMINDSPANWWFSAWASPVFRWAGSKRKLIPELARSVPREFDRYIEPFAGSACLFFALRPRKAVLGDFNAELIRSYQTIRKHPRLVFRIANELPKTKRAYYAARNRDLSSLDDVTRAATFTYLNRYCFNGVYRTNRLGRFNVPRGIRTGDLPNEDHFCQCAIALRAAKLVAADFEDCLKDVRKGDFVYLDPPYAVRGARNRGEYGYCSFSERDLPRLGAALRRIQNAGATFLLSYADCKDIRSISAQWSRRRVKTRRHVAGFEASRSEVDEVLISNVPFA